MANKQERKRWAESLTVKEIIASGLDTDRVGDIRWVKDGVEEHLDGWLASIPQAHMNGLESGREQSDPFRPGIAFGRTYG